MRRPRIERNSFLPLVLCAVFASAGRGDERPRWEAPPIRDAVTVRDGRTGKLVTLDAMIDSLAAADVVFLGETHTDETTHRLELAVYQGLLQRKQQQVVLAMEMFERDVQSVLDDYLAGRIDESTFLDKSRPWENYATAYRPLIEAAKSAGRPVVASNFPAPLRMKFAMQGAAAIDALTPQQRKQVPREFLPNSDAYWQRVDNAVRGHLAMMGSTDKDSRLYSTQSLWDNSMGEACADAVDAHPGWTVLHVNGGFHSAYWDGTVHQLQQRKKDARVKTVAIVPAMDPASVELEGEPEADYVAAVEARATDLNQGTWSVYTEQQLEYRLHLPDKASSQQKVPLLIWFSDDGLRSSDGLDLWKDRIGNDVAIASIEAPYRETQSDLGIGGRWFWQDSFASDLGTMVVAAERIWGYIMRHYPIDPQRVCVAGEGTGATVAAAIALLSDRIDLKGVAVDPRFYAKLKDFPLPLPDEQGDLKPPEKSLQVFGDQADRQWWSSELAQYTQIGIASQTVARTDDLWQRETQEENAVREALALPASTAPGGERLYLLVDQDSPRAVQWARLHAQWLSTTGQKAVAVVTQPPDNQDASQLPTGIRPQAFSAAGALPQCPGPFGGTTVVVLPHDASATMRDAWLAIEENDPLASRSRFLRVRIVTGSGDRTLVAVLEKLRSENRKNILIVPATFCADTAWMHELKHAVRGLENQMTFHWLPGLGGQHVRLDAIATAATDLPLRHDLSVTLDPKTNFLHVRDRIRLPQSLCQAGTEFTLHASLQIKASTPAVEPTGKQSESLRRSYRLTAAPSDGYVELTYEGKIYHKLSEQKEEYTRGFRQTAGIIGPEGVYLDGGAGWVPEFNDQLIQFAMEVQLPEGWEVISQGAGTSRSAAGTAQWDSQGLMEQVYLVGGPLHRYADAAGAVETLVYLHDRDESLARKYLDATARYLEMYRSLIGPYPYGKFALVENFWETGYGMPSFTLLGPQVIRFPFILTSSYPHEILHNWWGNSVFVDYASGNWCEGLTAYLADHLMQEQRQATAGAEYRADRCRSIGTMSRKDVIFR